MSSPKLLDSKMDRSPPSSSSNSPITPVTRVKVSNLSSLTTEESVKEYFSFCGEIVSLHLYEAKNLIGETVKEALITFETEYGATTACLITGALVDGHNIAVELWPEKKNEAKNKHNVGNGTTKITGVRAIDSAAVAVGGKISAVDEKLGISQGVKSAYGAGVSSMKSLDEKYQVRERASIAASTAKQKALEIDEKLGISERASSIGRNMAAFLGLRSSSTTPSNQSNRSTSPAQTEGEAVKTKTNPE